MKRTNLQIMLRLIVLIRPLLIFMVLAVLLGVLGNLAATSVSVLGAVGIANIIGKTGISLTAIVLLMIILALLRGFLRYGEQAGNHYIAFKLLALIRDRVFYKLRELSPAKMDRKDKGDLINIITSDIELLEVFYAHTISPIMIAVIYSLLITTFIAGNSLLLGLIALTAYLAVGLAIPVYIAKRSGDTAYDLRQKSGQFSAFLLDSLRGINELINFGYGTKRQEEINVKSRQLATLERRARAMAADNSALTGTLILMFDLTMLFAGAYLVWTGSLGFSAFVVVQVLFMSSFGPCVALANLGSGLENTMAAANRVIDILDEKARTIDIINGRDVEYEEAAFVKVDFAYDKQNVLKDFDLSLPKDKILGISGRSGKGKSTILKLLMRFYDPDRGQVEINKSDLKTVNTTSLRNNISYMTQDVHLFHDSIVNNIRIGKPDASLEEVRSAAKKAMIDDFIMGLENGYDTEVGELGDTLSGGEKQRISLARAFLHDAPLLLMDEPTSNLDSLNEAMILKSIKRAAKDRTIVLISHRRSSLNVCDDIFMMGGGHDGKD